MVGVCPALLSSGSCTNDRCRFHHDVHICETCNVVCLTGNAYQAHIAGRNHRETLRRGPPVQENGIDTEFCELCKIRIVNNDRQRHERTKRHLTKQRFFTLKSLLEEAEKDKNGISVSSSEGVDFGIIELEEAHAGIDVTLVITTTVPLSGVRLVDVRLTSTSSRNRTSPFSMNFTRGDIVYGQETRVTVSFTQTYRGRCNDRAEIMFEDTRLGKEFVIVRTLRVIVGSRADHATFQPTAPYVPNEHTHRDPVNEDEIILGVAPESNAAIKWVVPLPKAKIPANITRAVGLSGSTKVQVKEIRGRALPRSFDVATHGRYFKTLLWVEEVQLDKDLGRYDISDATLVKEGRYHYLEVPGLAEKRPSVLEGDSILVQPQGGTRWFEGRVHVIRQEDVGLCFSRSFRVTSPRQKFSVRFRLNRHPLRRQHQAMDTVFEQDRVLFPDTEHFGAITRPGILGVRGVIYNPGIASNEAQLQAIASIMGLPEGSPPFCIFGPPGTGKTVTIVEAMRQLLRQDPLARILVCAPSNSAADLIAERLAEFLSSDELFRFYAPSRSKEATSSKLKDYTHRVQETYSVPSMSRMTEFKVIVSTCVSASVFHGIGMERGHFGYIFVDEAGQAAEPEVMIAVRTMADGATRVILSGDHKQLGPIIRSKVAKELGLETSYLERLMNRGEYEEVENFGVSVVKLVKNFRSHEAILKFPNDNFYKGDLQASAPRHLIDCFIDKRILPNPQFPILFHGIVGAEDREESSPSFFNIDEITETRAYVMKLKRDYGITDHEIGVITPYNAQVQRIRGALKANAGEVKVGSVEEFQGQERKVIIISTVRSNTEYIEFDLGHSLGFVANPRRFNVAVTRAMALLIVIGNPEILSLDPMWRSFLNYIGRNDGCTGAEFSWDCNKEVDVAGDYAGGYRDAGIFDMDALMIRLQERVLAEASTGGDESDGN